MYTWLHLAIVWLAEVIVLFPSLAVWVEGKRGEALAFFEEVVHRAIRGHLLYVRKMMLASGFAGITGHCHLHKIRSFFQFILSFLFLYSSLLCSSAPLLGNESYNSLSFSFHLIILLCFPSCLPSFLLQSPMYHLFSQSNVFSSGILNLTSPLSTQSCWSYFSQISYIFFSWLLQLPAI